jgi:hypothetical protein
VLGVRCWEVEPSLQRPSPGTQSPVPSLQLLIGTTLARCLGDGDDGAEAGFGFLEVPLAVSGVHGIDYDGVVFAARMFAEDI